MTTNQAATQYAEGIEVNAPVSAEFAEILTPEALSFIAKLSRAFEARREELLQKRVQRQAELDAGKMPDFLPETEHIRTSDWTVAPIPPDLQDRRVEITGPVDRKMVINALNSGAKVFMADFEDAHSPNLGSDNSGSDQCARRYSAHNYVYQPRRERIPVEREDCCTAGTPARLASERETCSCGWQTRLRRYLRLRAVLLP